MADEGTDSKHALSLRGKRIGFETELKEDQDDDDVKKEYCAAVRQIRRQRNTAGVIDCIGDASVGKKCNFLRPGRGGSLQIAAASTFHSFATKIFDEEAAVVKISTNKWLRRRRRSTF